MGVAAILLLVVNIVYATSPVVTRLVLDDVPPITLALLRLVLGAAVLVPFGGGARATPAGQGARVFWMGALGFAAAFALSHWGIARSSATNAALLIVVEPLTLVILGPLLLGERLTKREAAGAAVAVAGAGLVVLNGVPGVTLDVLPRWRGDILLVLSGVAYASYSLLGRTVLTDTNTAAITARSIVWGAVVMAPLAALEWGAGARPSATGSALLGTLYLALVITAGAYLVWNWALARVEAARAAPFLTVQPVVGALLGAIVLGEPVTPCTAPTQSAAMAALMFGRRMVEGGWMVVTGAGAGIMGAAQEGAGGERSFGLNIRLPFEQEANPWIASDPKLITFKYFFTRKLFLVKEASAIALFPGGFGTMDECFEFLTLAQTGKAEIVPVVLVEAGPKPYWRIWDRWIGTLVERRLIDANDTAVYRIVDTVDEAVAEITGFYRVYHSSRIVGDRLVLRLLRPLADTQLVELQGKFDDILKGPAEQAPGPVAQEFNEFHELPRLILKFDRSSYSPLRQLIDFVNGL